MSKSRYALATLGAVALAGAAGLPFAASAQVGVSAIHQGNESTAHPSQTDKANKADKAKSCYGQLGRVVSGEGVDSQNFETAFDQYDSAGADDFTLRGSCVVTKVSVAGDYYNGLGPASSIHVIFYHDSSGQVGKVLSTQDKLRYSDPTHGGDFAVSLRTPVRLAPGRYWVSVQANLSYTVGGQWAWINNETLRGYKSKWINPGDGFLTGCTTWTDTVECFSGGNGPDFAFDLLK